ncbi:hypothetical protein RJ639_002921 [Escallonia herrerae]|uniref:F-box domain-containing protein n=1 Tax=Escallonia herrerae TaxID=1293975 RepID=A0AA88W235_9ASTE|nr:hypothetical protein RJ639_002921 [Escallonia herrerae]
MARANATLSRHLPPEITFDVLSRLPAKTVMRFSCVCKEWHALVCDSTFVTTHLKRSSSTGGGYMALIADNDYRADQKFCTLLCEKTCTKQAKVEPPPYLLESRNFVNIGSCNGLICFKIYACTEECSTLYMWNPIIGIFKPLPPSFFCDSDLDTSATLGIAFHASTSDYKVVKITYYHRGGTPEVEIYSLSTDSWKRINGATVPRVRCPESASLNGIIHWLNTPLKGGWEMAITTFDVGEELFGEMALPINYDEADARYSIESIVVVEECLTSLFASLNDRRHCSVWMMKEYGVEASWTKLYNICLQGGEPYGLSVNGKVLHTAERTDATSKITEEYIAYDPENSTYTQLGGTAFYSDIVTIKESLGLLGCKGCVFS